MYFKAFFKKIQFLILLMAIIMPWQVKAQETLTVYDGTDPGATTSNNNFIPMYGGYFDEYTKSEFIIPAEKLADMQSGEITSLKFYISSVSSYGNNSWENTHQKVFLKEVESTTLSAYSGMEGAVVVFDDTFVKPASTDTEFEISFTTNYEYQGGNLLIGIYNTAKGKYHTVTWKGETVNGASASGNNSSSLNNCSFTQKNFIPQTTFSYIPSGGVSCAKPKNFNTESITAHTAALTWTAGDEESAWDVFVTTDSEVVPDDDTTPTYQVMTCSKTLTELTAQTTYYAYVRTNCGGEYSKWVKKVFSTTREALLVDQSHPYGQDFETANDWGFTNGTLTNQWCWGSATNNGGEKAMYISNDNGVSNAYTLNNAAVVFASKLLNFADGTYTFRAVEEASLRRQSTT